MAPDQDAHKLLNEDFLALDEERKGRIIGCLKALSDLQRTDA